MDEIPLVTEYLYKLENELYYPTIFGSIELCLTLNPSQRPTAKKLSECIDRLSKKQ